MGLAQTTFVWDGGHPSQDAWTQDKNWNPTGSPTTDGTANVVFTGGIRLTPDVNNPWNINSLTFDIAASGFQLGGDMLTLQGTSVSAAIANNSVSAQIIDNALTLGSSQAWNANAGNLTFNGSIAIASHTLTITGAKDTTAAGAITGGGALIKDGGGTLTLSGANTYGGGTTITSGVLRTRTASLPTTGDITNNASLVFDQATGGIYAGNITGSGSLTKEGVGAVTLSGSNAYLGTTTVTGGTLVLGAANILDNMAAVIVDPAGTLQLNAGSETIGSLAGAGTVNLGSHVLTSGAAGTSTTFSGIIAGSGGLEKVGAGTLLLEGANTFTGGTTITAGAVQGTTTSLVGNFSNSGSLVFDQTTAGTFAGIVSGNGTLTLQNSGNITLTSVQTYTGDTNINAGTLTLGAGGGLADNGAVNVASGATLRLNAAAETVGSIAGGGSIDLGSFTLTSGGTNASTTFAGVISGNATGKLEKVGTGTLVLTGANTYAGGTLISAGIVQGNSTSLQGNIVNHAGLVFDETTTTTNTFAGIISGTGSVTKQNSGVVTLSGANTYSGTTTVNGGTLALGANNALSATSNLILNSATTLDLAGYSAKVGTLGFNTAVIDFGLVSATNYFLFTDGTASTGTLTINNFNSGDGDILAFSTGATGVDAAFVNGVYFYGIGGGVVSATNQSVPGYGTGWSYITPNTTAFFTWDGGGNNSNWNQASNWSGDIAPASGTNLKLAFDGATRLSPIMNGGYTANTVRFNSGAESFVLSGSGSNALTLAGAVPSIIQISAKEQTINMPLVMDSITVVETTGSGAAVPAAEDGRLTISGVISGTGGINKVGGRELILSGANTFTGATIVNEGTTVLRHATALGSTAAGTTVSVGATLQLANSISVGAEALTLNGTLRSDGGTNSFGGLISGTGNIVVSADSLTLSGASHNTYSGLTEVTGGTLTLAKNADVIAVSGNLIIGDGAGVDTVVLGANQQIANNRNVTLGTGGSPVFNLNGKTETIGSLTSANTSAAVQLGAGSLLTGGDNTSTTFAGVISGTGTVTKQGTGTFTLSGANTFSGETTISDGTVVLQNSAALGTTAGGTTVNGGAILQLENNISVGAEALALSGLLRNASGDNTFAGAISGTGGVTVAGGSLTLAGTAANSFTGATTVNAGTLDLNKSAGVTAVSGNLTIGDGSGTDTVRIRASNQIADGSAVTLSSGGSPVLNVAGAAESFAETIGSLASSNAAASVTLGGGSLAAGANNASTSFAGIISGTGSFAKEGTGTLTLSGANTYTGGTTVSGGTLLLGASNVLADAGNLSLGAGATLSLGGTRSERVNLLSFNSGALDFGDAGTNNFFLFTNGGSTTGALTVSNWTSGNDVFGVSTNTLSQAFLDNVFFSGINVGIGAVISASPVAVGSYGNFYTLTPIPTFIWSGANTSGSASDQDNWSQKNNWSGGIAPAVGAIKAIVMAGTVQTTNDMNEAFQVKSLLFRADAGAFTLNSSTLETMTVSGGGINNQSTFTQTLNMSIALGAAQTWTSGAGDMVFNGNVLNGAHTLTVTGNQDTTLNGILGGGAGGLVKDGTGVLTLTATNTFTGGMTLNGGTVEVASNGNLGATSGGLAFNGGTLRTSGALTSARAITLGTGGGTFDSNGYNSTLSGLISGSGGFTKSGAGSLTISGANTFTGATTVNSGTLTAGAANVLSNQTVLSVASGGTFNLANYNQGVGSIAGAGAITLGTGTLTTGTNNASTTFSGVISGTGTLTKTGTGALTLTGANTYSGVTTVANGTLVIGASNALSTSTSLTISNGATLGLASGVTNVIAGISAGTTSTISLAAGATLSINSASSSSVLGAVLGSGTLAFTGGGNLTLGHNVNFEHGTLVFGGTTIGGTPTSTLFLGNNPMVGTLHITGDTILDFGNSTSSVLTAANFQIDAGVKISINNWVEWQDYFFAADWAGATHDSPDAGSASQVDFSTWSTPTTWQSWDNQITPTPEPETYGAILMSVGSSRVDLQACKLEYSIVSPK